MTVSTVGAGSDPFADYRAEALEPKTRELKQEMNKELFLELLVASVKYQDPSEPMKTQEMVQQTTTLSQMEQMMAMTKVSQAQYALSQRTAAASLVGAEVSYVSGGATKSAIVQAVRLEGDNVRVDIGGNEVSLADIVRVGAPSQAAGAQAQSQGGAQQGGAQQGAAAPAAAAAAPAAPAPAAPVAPSASATDQAPAAAVRADPAATPAAAPSEPVATDSADSSADAPAEPAPTTGESADTTA